MVDYGLRFSELGQTIIMVNNHSTDPLVFVHTDTCEPGAAVSRVSDEWLKGPPKVDDMIPAGHSSFVVGKLDKTIFPREHAIFMAFKNHPDVIVAIWVMTYTGGSVRVTVDRFVNGSGYNGRADLVSIDGATSTITIDIPPVDYWVVAKRANEAYDESRDEGRFDVEFASGIISTTLGTLITTCFVVPGWGPGAVALTLLEGVIHMGLMKTAETQRATVSQFSKLLDATAKLFQQEHFQQLKSAMRTVATSFAEHNFGINATFGTICKRLELQADKTNIEHDLKQKIEDCLRELFKVVDNNGPLMKALEACLNDMDNASEGFESPSKGRLAMIFAAASMTMDAYALGTALSACIKNDSSGWKPLTTDTSPLINTFSADRVLQWLWRTVDRIKSWKVEENAKATRFGRVCIEMDNITERKAGLARVIVYDAGFGVANWAPGSQDEIDKLLAPFGMSRDGANWYLNVPSWSKKGPRHGNHDAVKVKYNEAKRVGEGYKAYLDQLVSVECDKFFLGPLATLEESGTPYFSHLSAPHDPRKEDAIPSLVLVGMPPLVLPAKLKFRFVQYGYNFANNRGGESLVVWQKDLTEIAGSEKRKNGESIFSYCQGAGITVPKDPWNAKAKAFAAKANAAAEAIDPHHRKIPTPYSSSTRIVHRRLCTTENRNEWNEATERVDRVRSLDNSESDQFFDDWSDILKTIG